MSEELKALERIKKFYPTWRLSNREAFNLIETALKDYEMEHALRIRLENINYELVKEKQENKKKLKAFEIIKEKDVDVATLKGILNADKNLHTASYYNSYFVATYRHLTQEEFDLLKEVLL